MTDLGAVVGDPQFGLRRRHQARLFQQQQQQEQNLDDNDTNSILEDDREEEEGEGREDDEDQSMNSRDQQGGPQQQPRPQQRPVRGWLQRILFPEQHDIELPSRSGAQRRRQSITPPTATTATATHTQSNNHHLEDPNVTVRASRAYCVLSTILAILAIVAATPPPNLSVLWTGQLPLTTSSLDRAMKLDISQNNSPVAVADSSSLFASGAGTPFEKSAIASDTDTVDVDIVSSHPRDWWQVMQQMWNVQSPLASSLVGDTEQSTQRTVNQRQSSSLSSSAQHMINADTDILKNPAWWARIFSFKASVSSDGSNGNQSQDSIKNKKNHLPKEPQGVPNNSHSMYNNDNDSVNHDTPTSWSSRRYFQNMIHSFLLRYRLYIHSWIDPVLLNPTSQTPTDIIDKILTSTPRLLAIANFLLAMTYLLHSAVAAWFLGPEQQPHQLQDESVQVPLMVDWANGTATIAPGTNRHPHPAATAALNAAGNSGARERMGGFLVFKLLLISAVVAPDTLDLLILLTWYTTLSCLRSLDHLAHATTTHLAALGQPPRTGVVQLLCLVLVCDIVAAASCVALFHAAGWGMVILLTCDCALLAADVLRHILKHLQCVLEDAHTSTIQELERQQLALHSNDGHRNSNSSGDDDTHHDTTRNDSRDWQGGTVDDDSRHNNGIGQQEPGEEIQTRSNNMTQIEIQQESRRLDRHMEVLELVHARRLSILDSVMFTLELICHLFTVAHFCHIWSLHGIQFTLIDGVLALHLHSAISTACKKVAQRRNIYSIARDLQGHFPNASDEELRKASAAGDVCCICLGTMSTGGHVKKVRCGHLYHTHCLREVVERAHCIQAAKCPLCRASLIDGTHEHSDTNSDRQRNNVQGPAPVAQQQQAVAAAAADIPRVMGAGERALFRFSTEGILPTWVPIPAFSFEVVRRSPVGVAGGNVGGTHQQIQFIAQQQPLPRSDEALEGPPEMAQMGGVPRAVPGGVSNNGDEGPQYNLILPPPLPTLPAQQQNQEMPTTSFLRRLLVLAGAIPMSPEEEARALAQLVDMFPQYDRSDLLRELQERGSAEGVAEAILMGIFSGVPRGD